MEWPHTGPPQLPNTSMTRPKTPWFILIPAAVLVAVFLIVGAQAFRTAEEAAPGEFEHRQLALTQAAIAGLSILAALAGTGFTLASSLRTNRFLEREVDAKTRQLEESNRKLQAAWDDLQASHRFRQSVLDGVGDPIMVIGPDYRVELMNRAAREFSSGEAEVLGPLFCFRLSHQRDVPCSGAEHPCPLDLVRESGQVVTVVHEHRQANGDWRYVELLASPLRGEDGSFRGIIESARDITEHKRAEEALEAAYAFQQTLVEEERHRIARELHDGLAQLLGYVNTKAIAVRVMLQKGQVKAAEQHLLQLEEAARELFVDVREAILDLKMSGQDSAGLVSTLNGYTAQFSRLSGLHVELTVAPGVDELPLTAEIDLQLLRITQEALANVRRHAEASQAWVTLQLQEGVLELTVRDDGKGFDLAKIGPTHWPHIGLSTMRERAEAIGAVFALDSQPGQGTRVTVRLEIKHEPPPHFAPKES
jgi:signal transduction histidine kinase